MYANKDLLNEFGYVHKIKYYGAFRIIHYSYLYVERTFFFLFPAFPTAFESQKPRSPPSLLCS